MRPTLAPLAALLAAAAPRTVAADGPACAPAGAIEVFALGSPADDLARVAELAGAVELRTRLIRRGGRRSETACSDASFPWPAFARPSPAGDAARHGPLLRPLPLRLTSAWNSTYPRGENDGLLWSGRGLSQLLEGGAEVRWAPFSVAIAPEVSWSENRAFDIVPNGRTGDLRFGNAFYPDGIDLPQRFGAEPFATWGPGQSHVRAELWNVALGLSSESLWFGPGVRNSILMSNAGPGFPHVFVGTAQPANVGIGRAELLLFWGRLERTRFIAGGGHPLVNGLVVTYAPKWIRGLSLGAARVFVQRWEDLTLRNWLSVFQSLEKRRLTAAYGPTGDNPLDNQLASVFARWVFPESGLEIYGEWAREDYNWSWWSTIREPDHSQAYQLGLQKVFRAGTRVVRFGAELTHLQELGGFGGGVGLPVYYVHGGDLGYTNRGQPLGAWIGPGADGQTVAVDVFHRGGRIGGYLERVRRNDAYYWAVVAPVEGDFSHDVEIVLGARQALVLGRVEVSWEASAAYRQNRDFIRHEPNFRAILALSVPLGRATP
jgi:hypothetical protein